MSNVSQLIQLCNPFKYRRELHNVRRVTDADFANGYRIKPGQPVACSGAWDRKGIITRVYAPEKTDYGTSLKIDVLFAGHYFAQPSRRVLSRQRFAYDYTTRQTRTIQRRDETIHRFEGKRHLVPRKLSTSTTTLYFRDGKLRHAYNGWVCVVPVK